ncbi:hypothetical protein [Celerinatantimonas sp. MCCC 1A17872]|uniref:hypothetical protein n=1 Tax=Celerinatantimonas sp. MCCC 1A17872 TaxID=3177514 RepID=UPI0038C68A80
MSNSYAISDSDLNTLQELQGTLQLMRFMLDDGTAKGDVLQVNPEHLSRFLELMNDQVSNVIQHVDGTSSIR